MESPGSSKSRSSNKRNNSFIELLKPEVEKMSANCKKYRLEIKSLREEVGRLRKDRQQIEYQIEQDNLKNKQEILKLNEIIDDLKHKLNLKDNNLLKNNNHLNQLNIQNNQQFNHHFNNHTTNHPTNYSTNHPIQKPPYANQTHQINHLANHPNHVNKVLFDKNVQRFNKNFADDSVKELIGSTMHQWISESSKKFESDFNDKVKNEKQKILIKVEKEVESIVDQLTRNKSKKSSALTLENKLDFDDQYSVRIDPEIRLIIKPLKNVVEIINKHFENKKDEIVNKIKELEICQRSLESSLTKTKENSIDNNLLEKIDHLETENQRLNSLNNQLEEKIDDLNKDKKLLNEINEKLKEDNKELMIGNTELSSECDRFEKDLDQMKSEKDELMQIKFNLNKQISELKKQNEVNFEYTILGKLEKEYEKLDKRFNDKFEELLTELKGILSLFFKMFKMSKLIFFFI